RRVTRLVLLLALAGCAVDRPAPIPTSLPTPYPVLARLGPRHPGIDFLAAVGSPAPAAAVSEARLATDRAHASRCVVVAPWGAVVTAYLHLADVAVRVGQRVHRGEPSGRAGMTGNATTPHLHFGVCRRPGGRCGVGTRAGWDDPSVYWIEGNACFEA